MNKRNHEETIEKYYQFYKMLSTWGEFNGLTMCKYHKISNNAVSALVKIGYIRKRASGVFIWNGDTILRDEIKTMLSEINEKNKMYHRKKAAERKAAKALQNQPEIFEEKQKTGLSAIDINNVNGLSIKDAGLPKTCRCGIEKPKKPLTDDERTERCIAWIKSLGGKVMMPQTKFVEV
jgi:hypothetical protein